MPRFSKRAKRHAAESKQRTRRMLHDAPYRSGPVTVSYLPGFEPPPQTADDLERSTRTRFPFHATINGRDATVHEDRIDYAN